MRIWDLPPRQLCRKHLLGEHRELHAIWTILTQQKKGYQKHPETLRWAHKLKALYARHETLVREMTQRGYRHRSPLNRKLVSGKGTQETLIDSLKDQKKILQGKKCDCRV